jgi:hypothetical protein
LNNEKAAEKPLFSFSMNLAFAPGATPFREPLEAPAFRLLRSRVQ